ncbi:LysR family transcriptional regulator [Enterococcus hulanensis]|uniref:LysR family transcriptional regulator n=1 Tax=Enterococcus hulanensis TaxID=2559929 RepID=UPI001A8DA53E|nr:LysR family transcriptional regulator [Enterococcus hulanensis]MBO0458149.1 LysR family transcriptional regulator [Enterococcus hulanensis]
MELRVIKYFLSIVQEKSISNAAKYLHLSQPTLSKQIKQLEEELGVELLIRGNREVSLTEEGQYFYNRAREIISLVEITTNNLINDQVITGEITIGGGETIAMQCIAKIIRKITRDNPEVLIHLFSGQADEVLQKLDKGLIDFGVVIGPVEKQKYECLRLPVVDQWGLLVKENHPLYSNEKICPDDLNNISLLINDQSTVSKQIEDWYGKSLDNSKIIGSYNLLYNASLMVKEEVGCALCIDGIINTENSSLKFVPLYPTLQAKISIVWKKNQVFSHAAALFLKTIRAAIESEKSTESFFWT